MTTATVSQKQDVYVKLDETGRSPQDSCGDAQREFDYVIPAYIRREMDRSLVSVKRDACGVETDYTAASGCDDLKSPYTTVQDEGSFDATDEAGGLTEADVRRMRAVFEHEVSNNTRMNYRAQWRRFTDWAQKRGTNALSCGPGSGRPPTLPNAWSCIGISPQRFVLLPRR